MTKSCYVASRHIQNLLGAFLNVKIQYLMVSKKIIHYSCEVGIEKFVLCNHNLLSLVMLNGDPRDGFFCPSLTVMIDYYSLIWYVLPPGLSTGWRPLCLSQIGNYFHLYWGHPFCTDGLSHTISMVLSIWYSKGLPVKISPKWCISVPKGYFYLGEQCRPWWNPASFFISSESSLFAKVPVYQYPE